MTGALRQPVLYTHRHRQTFCSAHQPQCGEEPARHPVARAEQKKRSPGHCGTCDALRPTAAAATQRGVSACHQLPPCRSPRRRDGARRAAACIQLCCCCCCCTVAASVEDGVRLRRPSVAAPLLRRHRLSMHSHTCTRSACGPALPALLSSPTAPPRAPFARSTANRPSLSLHIQRCEHLLSRGAPVSDRVCHRGHQGWCFCRAPASHPTRH